MGLTELTPVEAVFPSLRVSSKKALFQELAHRLSGLYDLNARALQDGLIERERLGATGMGRGVAIPHCRLAGRSTIVGALARLATPLDFEAPDGQLVDLVWVLVAPDDAGAEHLRALARVSRALRDPDFCAKLRGATDAEAIHALITAAEELAPV